ncbi:MAG: type II toxin-antitoxin system HipA family toxin [Bacteroidales bacterium]|nr:type II toxin-antitoxin system HipA family toxin [Bacteroidales bacterium]
MENNPVVIWLWGKVVGYLSWDARQRCSIFVYDEGFLSSSWDVAPLGWSVHSPSALAPRYGNKDKLYSGLPPFVADSLPDRWGNRVFEAWARRNGISHRDLTPLDRLSFIGKRGMGALEYEPAQLQTGEVLPLQMSELYLLALAIQEERQEVWLKGGVDVLLEDIYRVGTSVGGKRAKAVVAINSEGDIRSGQAELPADYVHYILKFNDDKDFPFSEVEYAYYKMACAAGIAMMPSRMMSIGNKRHFLTERFDRRDGGKLHVLTLAAMDPYAVSYEDLFAVCRRLRLPQTQQRELFRRMVFNVLGCNVDDHSKNFSFLMDKHGKWSVAPAYDMLFSVDLDGPKYLNRHSLSICSKTGGITLDDLRRFSEENDITKADSIIMEVCQAVSQWDQFSAEAQVPERWRARIGEEMSDILQ